MYISKSEIKAYLGELRKYSKAAEEQLLKVWNVAQKLPVAEAREIMIAEMMQLEAKYGSAAAYRGAELVETFLPETYKAIVGEGASPKRIRKQVQSAMEFTVNGEPEKTAQRLSESMDRYIKHSAREIPILTAERYENEVAFARVPQGPTTCSFCVMLASRGFVYHSAKTAGEFNRFHSNCDCAVVPGVPSVTEIEGYNPDELFDRWQKAREEVGLGKKSQLTSADHQAISDHRC